MSVKKIVDAKKGEQKVEMPARESQPAEQKDHEHMKKE